MNGLVKLLVSLKSFKSLAPEEWEMCMKRNNRIHTGRSHLKIVKSAAVSPATLQRFEMESEMLARLQHPGIAQVYDSGHQIQDDVLLAVFCYGVCSRKQVYYGLL